MLWCPFIANSYYKIQILSPSLKFTRRRLLICAFTLGPPGMNPMNPRMNPPRGPAMGPLGPGSYGPGLRGPPPNSSLGPGGPMPPMSMTGPGGRPQWQPNTSTVSRPDRSFFYTF